MDHVARRKEEIARYYGAYANPRYGMPQRRRDVLQSYLESISIRTMLDVGCGRGESLDVAWRCGVTALGCEVVSYLCDRNGVQQIEGAHVLPYLDSCIDLVTNIDVMEHLVEEDVVPAIREFCRVASQLVLLGISCMPDQYHITVHEPEWWRAKVEEAVDYPFREPDLPLTASRYVYYEIDVT